MSPDEQVRQTCWLASDRHRSRQQLTCHVLPTMTSFSLKETRGGGTGDSGRPEGAGGFRVPAYPKTRWDVHVVRMQGLLCLKKPV